MLTKVRTTRSLHSSNVSASRVCDSLKSRQVSDKNRNDINLTSGVLFTILHQEVADAGLWRRVGFFSSR